MTSISLCRGLVSVYVVCKCMRVLYIMVSSVPFGLMKQPPFTASFFVLYHTYIVISEYVLSHLVWVCVFLIERGNVSHTFLDIRTDRPLRGSIYSEDRCRRIQILFYKGTKQLLHVLSLIRYLAVSIQMNCLVK